MRIAAAALSLVLAAPVFGQQPASPAPNPAPPAALASPDPAVAPPSHPITLAQTRELFALMDFDRIMDQLMQRIVSIQREQAPYIPDAVWDDFRATFKQANFVEAFLPVYQKYISEEDAQRTLEFYRTPAGQHMLKTMPPLMTEVSRVGAQKGQEIARSVLDRHTDEIKAAEKKYEEQK